MFKSIKKLASNRHYHTQKAIFNGLIATRKVNKHVRQESATLATETKLTWKAAMKAAI